MTDRDDSLTRLRSARLYLLATTGVAAAAGSDLVDATAAALAGGVNIVQFREKAGSDADWVSLATELAALCAEAGALFIVNDRLGLAVTCRADGVHLGQEDAGVATARSALPAAALVGISTHDEPELERALADGADYVGVGSLYPTATKGRHVPVGGPTRLGPLAQRAERAGVPAFGIGGISTARAGDVVAAGFRRIAVCAAIIGAPNPEAAARDLRAQLG